MSIIKLFVCMLLAIGDVYIHPWFFLEFWIFYKHDYNIVIYGAFSDQPVLNFAFFWTWPEFVFTFSNCFWYKKTTQSKENFVFYEFLHGIYGESACLQYYTIMYLAWIMNVFCPLHLWHVSCRRKINISYQFLLMYQLPLLAVLIPTWHAIYCNVAFLGSCPIFCTFLVMAHFLVKMKRCNCYCDYQFLRMYISTHHEIWFLCARDLSIMLSDVHLVPNYAGFYYPTWILSFSRQ